MKADSDPSYKMVDDILMESSEEACRGLTVYWSQGLHDESLKSAAMNRELTMVLSAAMIPLWV